MQAKIKRQLATVLKHLYINPLEKCNLKCKICYTKKTAPILAPETIVEFIDRYEVVQPLETITFCGGEVFALTYFPALLNTLNQRGIFTQVITNGTLDQLDQIENPNFVNLIVSIDGIEAYHDANRGQGNFRKSLNFMKKAHRLGFHLNVFSILTHQNLAKIDLFEETLGQELGFLPEVTYHPRKPPAYLMHHPVSNIVGEVNGFDFLNKDEMLQVMKTRNVFPPKDLGCYQIAVMSDGKVYGCCEGVTPLGIMSDDISTLFAGMRQRLEVWARTNTLAGCLGCTQSEFMCGIKQYLELLNKG